LYKPTQGVVLVDGKSVYEYDRRFIRRSVGVVLQDSALVSGTIAENISLFAPGCSIEEIRKAAVLAGADDFIKKLPHEYLYEVGTFGVGLSSGQRQRIALARALLRKPPILILDEATSNLDVHKEKEILTSLRAVRNKATTIIITHRLTTALWAQRIVILNRGTITEAGTHEVLLRQRGTYHSMWQALAAGAGDLDGICSRS
jgi:ABC-type bacteriocin/lantibiotic exporter with double-glycine peptidase domain